MVCIGSGGPVAGWVSETASHVARSLSAGVWTMGPTLMQRARRVSCWAALVLS